VLGLALSLGVAYLSQVRAWRRARTAGPGHLVNGQPHTDPHVRELDSLVPPAPPPVPAAAGSQAERVVEPVLARSSSGAPTTPTNGTSTPKAPANGARVPVSQANGSVTPKASPTRSPLQMARVKGRSTPPGISKKARSKSS
jgi:hypothetical protein